MGKIDWDVVTNYTDVVTTALKTVTFPKVQEQVYLRNQGNANITYTIGSQSGTLTPGQSVTVNQDVSSYTVQAASGTHTFELRAKEKGTEIIETDNNLPSDVAGQLTSITSQLAEKANQSDVTNKVDKVTGKGLSTNDYDNTEKAEVAKVKNKADQSFAASIQTQVNSLVVASGNANAEVSQAHADSTGNTFPTIHSRLSNIEGMVFNRTFNFTPSWEVGSLLSADGSKTTDLNRIRSVDFLTYTVGSTITIAPASGYQFVRRYFDASGNYVSGDGGYITVSTTFTLTYPKMKIVLARVDSANMTIAEGSNITFTTDVTNVETKDARTDQNGSKFNSIGDNIRNSINGILTGWQKVIYSDWELGSIDVAGGNVTQTNRLRTSTFHSYPIGQRIKISVPTGYKFLRRYFDANNVYVTGDSAYITVDTEFNLAYPKFKLVMAKTDDSNITVDLSSNITISIKSFLSNRWTGKTWLTLGDSITARGWYQTKVLEDLGFINVNYGIGGTTIAQKDDADSTQAFCLRYTNMQATADIVTVWGGVNDFGQSIPLGTKGSTDKKTFYGALKVLIEGLLTKYQGKKLAFIATTPVNTTNASLEYIFGANGQGLTLKSYVDVLIEMCEEYSIPVLDLFRTSGFNQLNMTIMTSNVGQTAPDGLHPSMAGYEFIRPKLVNFLNNI